jgi:hypothetical protein
MLRIFTKNRMADLGGLKAINPILPKRFELF